MTVCSVSMSYLNFTYRNSRILEIEAEKIGGNED